MLIRSQGGKIYNLAYIAAFQVELATPSTTSDSGTADAGYEVYEVQALFPQPHQQGAYGAASHVALARTNGKDEADAIMDRIMRTNEGNLDLTQPEQLKPRTSEPDIAPPGFNAR